MNYAFSYRLPAEALYLALIGDALYITLEKSVTVGSAREALLRYMDCSMIWAAHYGKLLITSPPVRRTTGSWPERPAMVNTE